jgi:ribosomal protein L37AE/L43A
MSKRTGRTSRARSLLCPACEFGKLRARYATVSRCDDCGYVLSGAFLATLRQIIALPDAVGAHACECGHPEMRKLPGGVFHCPACRAEVTSCEPPRQDAERRR